MPSFNYSSPVKAVGQDVNIFDSSIFEDIEKDGVKIKRNSDGTLTLNGTYTGSSDWNYRFNMSNNIIAKSDTELYLNMIKIDGSVTGQIRFVLWESNENNRWMSFENTYYKNLLGGKIYNRASIVIFVGATFNNLTIGLKISNKKQTIYSPYNCGSASFTVCNRNLFKFEGITFKGTAKGWYDLCGKGEMYGAITTKSDKNVTLKAGTYVASYEERKNVLSLQLICGNEAKVINFNSTQNPNEVAFTLTEKTIVTPRILVDVADVDTYVKGFMIRESSITSSNYMPHEEQTKTIPIQKELLENDKFVKQNGRWYEKHNFGYVNTLNNTSITVTKSSTSTDEFFRYVVGLGATNRKTGSSLEIYCTHMKYASSRWNAVEGICGWETGTSFCISTFNKELDTAEKLKTFLQENNVEIYYELSEPEYIECTEEQTAILDEIETELHTYQGGTHVFSTDEISPIFNAKYSADLKAYINKELNPIVQEIVGG